MLGVLMSLAVTQFHRRQWLLSSLVWKDPGLKQKQAG